MKNLNFDEGFDIYIRSGFPLIVVDTIEIDRATETVIALTDRLNQKLPQTSAPEKLKMGGYPIYVWDIRNGWRKAEPNGYLSKPTRKPLSIQK